MAYRTAVRAEYDVALHIPGHSGRSGRVHGHRYVVEAVLEADGLDAQGFVIDFDAIQPKLAAIAAELDHRVLNDLEPFREGSPSAERQAEYFYRRLSEDLTGAVRLIKIRVTQEPDAWAEYRP